MILCMPAIEVTNVFPLECEYRYLNMAHATDNSNICKVVFVDNATGSECKVDYCKDF